MAKPLRFAGLLFVTSALTAPAFAQAPVAPASGEDSAAQANTVAASADAQDEAPTDVSIPGGGAIVVVGRRNANIEKSSTAVVTVLSTAEIARTGEGDIAGSLSHVTGLSVVGNGFVYVRGLGDRYSLALLNGSPLPSPEPLKRVVPLDVFPTNMIASSLVQKSYSANFPGEFGGGVINLTTIAVPRETFIQASSGVGIDSETTGRLSYTYYGSKSDWTGFDNGSRRWPSALVDFINSGQSIDAVDSSKIARTLVSSRNAAVLADHDTPINYSAGLTGGTAIDLGDSRLGVIATAGYSSKFRTRDNLQQSPQGPDLATPNEDFRKVISDNRIVVNGMLGLGLEFGDNKLRLNNLFIRDTLKYTSLAQGVKNTNQPGQDFIQQKTAWYERQLFDSQFTGEFKFGDFSLDLRGSYANSKRKAPYELDIEYDKTNQGLYGDYYVNDLNGQFASRPTIAFSDLNENLWSGGVDLSYRIVPAVSATIGYAYTDTKRRAARYEYQFNHGDIPENNPDIYKQIGLLRPDLLLSSAPIDYFGISLIDSNPKNHVFNAKLRVHAVYGKVNAELIDGLTLDTGARYEHADQATIPVELGSSTPGTSLKRSYLLPSATLTYAWGDNMQVRANLSKTIARPQFRELIFQSFYDPESNRTFLGNPFLTDSQLYNGELRYEWYFARDQHVSAAFFYKRIDHPIESYASFSENGITQSFANAPKANLYGIETEVQKNFDLDGVASSGFFSSRRFVVTANYTYTKSKVKVGADDTVTIFGGGGTASIRPALGFFVDGRSLIGQSDHVGNLEISLEDKDSLSQQTLILTYASERITERGANLYPDLVEKPGVQLDFVMRQGIKMFGGEAELKGEIRNITGHTYKEYQQSGANIIYANRYKMGTTFATSLSIKF